MIADSSLSRRLRVKANRRARICRHHLPCVSRSCLRRQEIGESQDYLKHQLITYIGNKRALLRLIEAGLNAVKAKLGQNRVRFLDLFAGSGVVSRMARQHASTIFCNDLEAYSAIINRCYQTNASEVDWHLLRRELRRVEAFVETHRVPGFIAELYAPADDNNIRRGERVFYTRRNAIFLDTFCTAIRATPEHLLPFVLPPVLSQASMYANTSGVFKGFYKNKEGIGQFGGTFKNALPRILREIEVCEPVLSRVECEATVFQEDANRLIRNLEPVDVAYFDPPYNQHPYGSNYFMLN